MLAGKFFVLICTEIVFFTGEDMMCREIAYPIYILVIYVCAIYTFKNDIRIFISYATAFIASYIIIFMIKVFFSTEEAYENWFKWVVYISIPFLTYIGSWIQNNCNILKKCITIEASEKSKSNDQSLLPLHTDAASFDNLSFGIRGKVDNLSFDIDPVDCIESNTYCT